MGDADKISIKNHQDLIVWQKAMDLVANVYKATNQFPKEELYSLTGQIRRSVVSIPVNMAEGQGRRLAGEYMQFPGNARGSLLEFDTHLEIALRLGYLASNQQFNIQSQLHEVGKLLNGLGRSLTSNI